LGKRFGEWIFTKLEKKFKKGREVVGVQCT
jgi:hypothetical protein